MKTSPFIFKSQKMRNIREFPNIPVCVEMHKSMWIDEFKNYGCHDLLGEGLLYENPDVLKTASDFVKDKVKRGSYIVHPVHASHFKEKGLGLSNYIYISDNKDGKMEIVWDVGQKDVIVNKTSYTGQRFTE